MRRVSAFGRRRLLRPIREVVEQGLHRGYARICDSTAGDFGESGVRDAGLCGDVTQIPPFAKQTSTDGFQPLIVLLGHSGLSRVTEPGDYPVMVILARTLIPNRITIFGNITDMTTKHANQILAENIRRLMRGHQTLSTQAALARKAGLAQSSIQRVLSAAVHPQLDVVEAIAKAFKVAPADLLTDEVDARDNRSEQGAAGLSELSNEDKEKVASYIRFLLYERALPMEQKEGNAEFIRLADLKELSVEQLAEVMRPTLREPNNTTHTSHDAAHSETKQKKSRAGN